MRRLSVLVIVLAILLAVAPARGQSTDKRGFSILNPTPRALWRPLGADRPDITESPITVDAGAVQLEASFFAYAHDSWNDSAETTNVLALALANIKLGLLNNTDLQLVFSPYIREETTPDGAGTTVAEGPSDLILRLKVNLWGNDDGGPTALGVLPFIKIPTGTSVSNGRVAGGVAVPFSWDITDGVSLGVMVELDALFNDTTRNHDLVFLHTTVLGFDIYGPLGGYVEHVGLAFLTGPKPYEGLASFGLTYEITEDVVLDGGALIGLTRAAPDVAVFTGITIRF